MLEKIIKLKCENNYSDSFHKYKNITENNPSLLQMIFQHNKIRATLEKNVLKPCSILWKFSADDVWNVLCQSSIVFC